MESTARLLRDAEPFQRSLDGRLGYLLVAQGRNNRNNLRSRAWLSNWSGDDGGYYGGYWYYYGDYGTARRRPGNARHTRRLVVRRHGGAL